MNTLTQMSKDTSAREVLAFFFEDLPISGGWGYSKKDAVVIDIEDSSLGVKLEYVFMRYRTICELNMTNREYEVVDFQITKQSLRYINKWFKTIPHDVLEFELTVNW